MLSFISKMFGCSPKVKPTVRRKKVYSGMYIESKKQFDAHGKYLTKLFNSCYPIKKVKSTPAPKQRTQEELLDPDFRMLGLK